MTQKLKQEQNPLSATVEKIREICPAAVNGDGKIDFDALKTSLGTDVADEQFEKYEFTWVGKNAAKIEANRPIRKTLRPVVADSRDWENTKNLYIEGDNLDALKLLQESYLGKVKMIYIDPPYNTGNDFVYCDDFTAACADYLDKKGQCDEDGNRLFKNTETNGRFHSDWCSMMYPRLKLARDLLSDDGVIFISIDDHEQANLKKICDEVFGEGNFVCDFIRKTKSMTGDESTGVNIQHENLLCYAKNKELLFLAGIEKDFKGYSNPDNDPNGEWTSADPSAKSGGDSTYFPIQNPYTGKEDLPPQGRYWAFSRNTLKEYISSGRIVFKHTHRATERGFIFKRYKNNLSSQFNAVNSLYATDNEFMNAVGTKELKELLTGDLFDNPKPTSLLKYIITSACGTMKDAIILDFFSGSATTAHAVMQLNAEDSGNRRFIMVQLPENLDENLKHATGSGANTIRNAIKRCDELHKPHLLTEVAKERIRRAGDKIVTETGRTDLDIGFRVLRVDSTNMADIERKPGDTTQAGLFDAVDNIKSDRSDLDLLFGVMVECGLMLDYPIELREMDGKKYYVVNGGDLVACFENDIPEKLIYEIARLKPTCAVFRDSSFADPAAKINLAEIFKNITGDDDCVKVL